MQKIRLNQKSPNFYELLGPVFGSRTIEQETNDRFYDDAEKEWFLLLDQDAYLASLLFPEKSSKISGPSTPTRQKPCCAKFFPKTGA